MKIKYLLIGLVLTALATLLPQLFLKSKEFAILVPMFSSIIFGCLGLGFALGLAFSPKNKGMEGKFFYIPPGAVENIKKAQRYMEHSTPADTLQKAMTYYALALEIVQKDRGKIVIHHNNGTRELFDPVSLEISPDDVDS